MCQAYRKFLKAVKTSGNLHAQCLAFNSIAVSYHYKGDLEEALTYHARHAKVAPDFRVRLDVDDSRFRVTALPRKCHCGFFVVVRWR